MGKITALRANSRRKRISIFVDGSFSFAINKESAVKNHLQVGQELSQNQIEELIQADLARYCFDAALQFLSYRPRSEAEVRQRLYRRSFSADAVDKTIIGLKEQNLIDDTVFAQFWKGNRLAFNPRSQQLIKRELRQKGISAETIDEVVGDLDDETSAYKAGQKKARASSTLDYDEFQRRLSAYLRWRGFNYEIINSVVARLWQEQQTASV